MQQLANRHVLLGVTGGIAAYKSADLVRRLAEAGAQVRVMMTRAATEFVSALTFQALSGNPVHTELLDPRAEAGMGHIELARWADLIVVAPASADTIARLVHGRADDLLTAVCLASDAARAMAPAMNRLMWANPVTQDNVAALAARGWAIWGPGEGDQACGETGPGRMLEPADITARAAQIFASELFTGQRLVITAGPTREALDPVRYLSNHSSGKMGFALAREAVAAGAQVTLVTGPVHLASPERVTRVDVTSAGEMHDAVLQRAGDCDVFIATAAVVDYRPASPAAHKIKKDRDTMTVELVRNPDILAEVAALEHPPFTVGFAAETYAVERYAKAKLDAKNLNMIAANQVGGADSAFDADDNRLQVYWPGGYASIERASKNKVARQLLELIAEQLHKD
ncbi:MAG: bifunctional phosphopantothenoylcysteine decarboxylase/phosphopantothenate--cysteine ligase CoaBC [Gammaproteobacteria bacterium]|nr:bifunctional phosphopantothenoylcysteine decarboxylase/phosphopantothenate--cysteine ligase CoaBC [Gammaproteobacteria bacterium]